MFDVLIKKQDKDSIRAKNFTKSLQSAEKFNYFVQNITVNEQNYLSLERQIHDSRRLLKELFQQAQVKIIRPMKVLCLKISKANAGCITLHSIFLDFVIKLSLFKEALPIIEQIVFPLCIQFNQTNLIISSIKILLELEQYQEAYNLFQELFQLVSEISRVQDFNTTKYYYALYYLFGKQDSHHKRCFEEFLTKHISKFEIMQIESSLKYFSYLCFPQYFQSLLENDEIGTMMMNNISSLQKQILLEKQSKVQRKHIKQLCEKKLNNVETMIKINFARNNAKYDCQNQILYFNFQPVSSMKQINKKVTKCYNLYIFTNQLQKRRKQKQKYMYDHEERRRYC